MLQDVFTTLGLKEEEIKTYLSLMALGASTASDLAKSLGIARPTVYGYLERLKTIGLVTESLRRSVKIFVPESADKLRQIYARKIEDLRKKEKALDSIIPELEKRSGMNLMRPRLQFFEGRDGIETALQDHLSYSNLEMLALWAIKVAIETTSEDFFWYLNKERIKKNMHLKGIWPHNQAVDVKRYPFMGVGPEFKREIRLAPDSVTASMGYWIYANKVLFTSSSAERFAFIIESAELVQMMSSQHQIIWNLSTPITPKATDMKPFLDDLYSDNDKKD